MRPKRRHSSALIPPPPLEALAALAGRTTFKEPVGGRGTKPGRTSLDVAAALSVGTARMSAGAAWGNVALLIATGRPVSIDGICDMVDAVLEDVQASLKVTVAERLKAGRLRVMLFSIIAGATGSRKTRKARGGELYRVNDKLLKRKPGDPMPHPDFHQNAGWLPTYAARAAAMRMRRADYEALEREVQAIIEAKISEAAASCGAT